MMNVPDHLPQQHPPPAPTGLPPVRRRSAKVAPAVVATALAVILAVGAAGWSDLEAAARAGTAVVAATLLVVARLLTPAGRLRPGWATPDDGGAARATRPGSVAQAVRWLPALVLVSCAVVAIRGLSEPDEAASDTPSTSTSSTSTTTQVTLLPTTPDGPAPSLVRDPIEVMIPVPLPTDPTTLDFSVGSDVSAALLAEGHDVADVALILMFGPGAEPGDAIVLTQPVVDSLRQSLADPDLPVRQFWGGSASTVIEIEMYVTG